MKLYVLGICGTFMAGLARLAKEKGLDVSGCDQNVYPPMSTQLQEAGIELTEGYQVDNLNGDESQLIIGNALSRGNPLVEHILNEKLDYISGPQWLGEQLLRERKVFAVAGTHGKTTTSSILAWILTYAGQQPGFLIGGVPENFDRSSQLGAQSPFVIEADEYDTAFFDKRSKFVHYHPDVLVLNNLEYDHADIFPNLEAIKTQFHHLLRIVPKDGLVIVNADDTRLAEVLHQGIWSQVQSFSLKGLETADWQSKLFKPDGRHFEIRYQDDFQSFEWQMTGEHNVSNALAAVAAAYYQGVDLSICSEALKAFKGVRRRMTSLGVIHGVEIYEDFAHHPTAIRMTLEGLRAKVGQRRIFVVLEPRSNSMRSGVHTKYIAPALSAADEVLLYTPPGVNWDPVEVIQNLHQVGSHHASSSVLIQALLDRVKSDDIVIFMSNGSFDAIPQQFLQALNLNSP